MTAELPPPTMIADAEGLQQLAQQLHNEPLIAVDTESNSLFAYREQVCLIQLSTRQHDWVIDPLAVQDLSALGPIFANPAIEKVFHAAEYDVMCMKRDYNFKFANLFDTMVSARISGRKAIGLGNLLEDYFGLQVDKHFQRADWSIRPIPAEQLTYAQQDTHYLPALRDLLAQEMQEKGFDIEAREVFDLLAEVPPAVRSFDADGFWRINAARDFNLRQMAILRELYLFRDQMADRRNRPAFKIMSDDTLANIVKALPAHLNDLDEIPGMSRGQVDRYGTGIMQAVRRGETAKIPVRPDQSPRVDPEILARFDALHKWRKARAIERGVESDVIVPKEVLWALARNVPHSLDDLDGVPGLGPWKRQKYGEELIKVLTTSQEQEDS